MSSQTNINSTTKPKPPITVQKITSSQECDSLFSVVNHWESSAKQLFQEAEKREIPEKEYFRNAWSIAGLLSMDLLGGVDIKSTDYFICRDDQESIQGCMTLASTATKISDFVKITFLLTNPENIKSPITSPKVSGIGSALVVQAEETALTNGSSTLRVYSYHASAPFYNRLGFIQDEEPSELSVRMSKCLLRP